MNIVILKGRITREITLAFGQSGIAYTSFSIAVDRGSKEKKETDFIFCTAFSNTAEFIQKFFKKGQEILIEGRLQISTKESNGVKSYSYTVIINKAEFSGSKTEEAKSKIEDMSEKKDDDEFPF